MICFCVLMLHYKCLIKVVYELLVEMVTYCGSIWNVLGLKILVFGLVCASSFEFGFMAMIMQMKWDHDGDSHCWKEVVAIERNFDLR